MPAVVRHHRSILVLLCGVIALYGALFVHVHRNFPDIGIGFDGRYTSTAEHMVRDGVFSLGERNDAGTLIPTAAVEPLYVFLYATSYRIFGIGPRAHEAMRVLQTALAIGVILVSWRLGSLFSRSAGLMAAIIAALDLTAWFFAQNYELPDTTLGFFLALWLLYFVIFLRVDPSPRFMFLSTFFYGLAIWTRMAASLLWPAIAVFLALFLWSNARMTRRAKLCAFAVFVGVVVVFVGGWSARNYRAIGYWGFSTHHTSVWWNASHLVAYQQGISFSEARAQLSQRYLTPDVLQLDAGAMQRYVMRHVAPLIMRAPVDFAIVTMRALPGFLFGTFPPYVLFDRGTADALRGAVTERHGNRTLVPTLWSEGRTGYVVIYALAKLHLILLYGAGAVAAAVFFRRRELRWTLALFVMTIVYVLAVSGAAAQARYRTMMFPIMYVLGGYGIAYGMRWWQERWKRAQVVEAPATHPL